MKLLTFMAAAAAVAAVASAPSYGHNAGCVETGNGDVVFVGSNKDAPTVPESNPNRNAGSGQLDLIPGAGDQYGARFAADQGNSAVQRPTAC